MATAILAVATVLLFFGLTRTQVGRDGLRGQVERAFARQFHGSIEIGRLTGNLVYDLYATDVRLRDPQGRVVLAADSIVVTPTWWGLLRRRLVIDEATVFRPRIDFVRSDSGRWNVADVFASRRPRTEGGEPLDFSAPSLRLVDATLTTRREGPAPAVVRNGTVFDYTNSSLTDLDLVAELKWSRDQRLIRIRELTAELGDPALPIRWLEGDLDFTDGDIRLSDIGLSTGTSWISGDFSRVRSAGDAPLLTLTLAPSRIDGEDLRRIVPISPLADAVDVSATVRGPLHDLSIEALTLERGETALQLGGTLAGLPDSAAFAVTIPRSVLLARDLEAVAPTLDLPDLRGLGTTTVQGEATGVIAGSRGFRLASTLDVRSAAGRADGTLDLAKRSGAPLAYGLDMDVRGLDPGRALADSSLAGSLTGRVALEGRGTNAQTLDASLRLALSASEFAGRVVDSLAVDMAAQGLRFEGTAAVVSGGGLRVSGVADWVAASPDFDIDLRAEGFDLRRLFDGAPATNLTADISLVGEGRRIDDFSGDVEFLFAPSSLTLAGEPRPIPAHAASLRLRPAGAGSPRLDLDSDLLGLRVGGDLDTGAFVALAAQWAESVARTVQIEENKFYHAPSDPSRLVPRAPAMSTDVEPQDVTLDIAIRQPEALRALLPGFPALAPGTALDARATFASDSLVLGLTAQGDSLRVPGFFSGPFAGTLRLRSGHGRSLLGRTALDLDLHADTLRIPIGPLADARAALRLRGRQADLTIRSARLGDAGRFDLDAGLALRPDRTRLTLREVVAAVGGQTWATTGTQTIDLYADAIVLADLAFERRQEEGEPPRLALDGVLSPLPGDSLFVDANALDLDEVFTLVGLRQLFGGRLDASFAVSGALGQPTVEGVAAVEEFAFAGRRAGRIDVSSRVLPEREGLAVDLHLMPDGDPRAVVNDLRATGTVRLPGIADDGTRDRGALDLGLDIDRLDLFIFDWLFPSIIADARGYATGTGRISGVPRVPLFDADLRVRDGRFRVPDFGLALEAEGRVTVDREGFHIRNAQLADKSGGQGLVRGDILFNDYRFFSFDLAADLAELEIIDVPDSRDLPFYGYIRATGSATLTGPIDNVFLRATDAQTTPDSEMFIPVTETGPASDAGFLVFADSLGNIPEFETRRSLIAQRPENERAFLDGLEMNLNVFAPPGSTVHLVFDPSIGDVITAVGSAQLQLAIREGDFLTFGTFDVTRGDYLFTAGDVFTRRFELEEGGTLRWDGDPIDARIQLPASYRTRASLAGLDLAGIDPRQRVPLIITLDVTGRVTSPLVNLSLALDESNRTVAGGEALRRQLNQSDRQAEYATSVLLTNSFLLAPSENPQTIREAADELLFTSLSQLVSSRLNLFLNDALGSDNVDVLFGVQQGATSQDFDLTYGVALRLLDERLVIRGEGIYQRLQDRPVSDELQGEVAVEVRLTPSVSLEVFYRREGDVLLGSGLSATPYGAYGAGVNYETDFESWNALLRRIIGEAAEEREEAASAAPF